MSAAAVQQTQVLDPDSLHSGTLRCFFGCSFHCFFRSHCPPDGNRGHHGGADFPAGETLALDCGETQPLDEFGVGVHDWGRTQVIDYSGETVVVEDEDDEGGLSERTILPNDREILVDDLCLEAESARSKDENLVDPDASTDEKEDSVRSCTGAARLALHFCLLLIL
ncbi:hypothetical protein AXF42_Ash012400 [Apostasia shenzhenica]|uniref:Uncharacterized protein n=1 Tax=Apostasia shenzhenica TaxID=1088818 RepID=A0A2I0AD28_9ASPA|nr:hypothetical protein AXF42_Ash012400 [Apostasia shenzhenica]